MMQSDAVDNESVDVGNCLGGHVGCWLVVGRLDGGELHLRERVSGAVLGGDYLITLHSLTPGENMEKVSQQLVVVAKLRGVRDLGGVYFCLPIQDAHVLCKNEKVSMYQYIPCRCVI